MEVGGVLAGCALIGGTAAWLSDRQSGAVRDADHDAEPRRGPALTWFTYVLGAVIATFAVPLFLRLADSSLVDHVLDPTGKADGARRSDAWVLVGFCLIAAFFSKAFIQTLAKRVLAMAETATKVAEDARQKTESNAQTLTAVEEALENLPSGGEPEPPRAPPSGRGLEPDLSRGVEPALSRGVDAAPTRSLEAEANDAPAGEDARAPAAPVADRDLSEPERRVLDALAHENFSRRTTSGTAQDVGLPVNTVRPILDALTRKGFVGMEISSKTGNRLYHRLY